MPTRVPPEAFDRRLDGVRTSLEQTDADAGVWFDATSIEYLTGFHHVQTERPVVLAVAGDQIAITVPRLEADRVAENRFIDDVFTYFDYPGGEPIETAAAMLEALGAVAVCADMDGAPGVMGYEGPALSEFVTVTEQDWVAGMRAAKSEIEVGLVSESAKWGS